MDGLLPEFAKYGLAGVLCGVIVGIALFLLRWITVRAEKSAETADKNAAEAIALLKAQIAKGDADLAWWRAELTTARNEYLASLREERAAREKHVDALLGILRADHKEAMGKLDAIHDGIEKLGDR